MSGPRRLAALALLGLALLAVPLPAAAQCVMCGSAVAGSEQGREISGELNKAILVMLAAPYAVFGTFVAVLFRERLARFGRGLLRRRAPAAS